MRILMNKRTSGQARLLSDGSRSGQAMTEMIVFLPLLAILIMMIMWIGNVMISWAFITQGARWGSDLIQFRNYGYSEATAAKVKTGIKGFLGADNLGNKHGRRLKQENLKIRIVNSGGDEISSFPNYPNLKDDPAGAIAGITNMDTIGVEVYYKVTVPKFFKAFEGLMAGGSGLPGYVQVGSRCEIISLGCGYVTLE